MDLFLQRYFLEESLECFGEQPLIVTSDCRLTYHQIHQHVSETMGRLREQGIEEGDRIAILSPNNSAYVILLLAFWRMGVIAVPMSMRWPQKQIIFRIIPGGGALAIPVPGLSLEENIGELQVTHVSMVSTQLYRLLRDCRNDVHLRRLKAVLIGGSAIPDHLIREGVKRGLPVFKSYGSTELASQVTTTHPNDTLEKRFTSGALLDYRDMQIAEDGEILLKGETLFRGYVEDRGVIKAVDEKGWFHSGDIGCLDEFGYLHVTGRKDNMFVSGGENIQPEEIEENLARIEGVKEAVVVPVKHEEFGFRPVAFLRMAHDHHFELKRIKECLEDKLPRFKIPAHFFPWPEEGDHSPLKPDRKALKEIAEELVRLSGME